MGIVLGYCPDFNGGLSWGRDSDREDVWVYRSGEP